MVSRRDQLIDARILKVHGQLEGEGLDQSVVLNRLDAQFPDHVSRIRELVTPLPSPEVSPERNLPTRYEVIKKIGEGGQGSVMHAYDRDTQRDVAIKICSSHEWDTTARARFAAEADHLKRLQGIHGICDIYGTGEVGGFPYIVMEFIDGRPIQSTDESNSNRREILARFERVARTLHAIHENGLCHRDIKPSNILVSPGGNTTLVDLGITVGDETSRYTRTGDVVGSLQFAPPERLAAPAGSPARNKEDIYSLGVSMYKVLARRLPFSAATDALLIKAIDRGLPKPLGIGGDIETVVSVAMARFPIDRYSTALELADDLRRLLDDEPITARSPRWSRRAYIAARRHPRIATATVLLAVILAVGGYAYRLVDNERALAERNRTVAIGLLERVSFGLFEELRDQPGGATMLGSLLALVEDSFAALGAVDADDLQIRSFGVLRHQLRSEVARIEGYFEKALREGRAAVAESSAIMQQFPASPKALRDWLVVSLHLTEVCSDAGNPTEAQMLLERARTHYGAAAVELVDDTVRSKDLITIDFISTRVAEQLSNYDTARLAYERATEALGSLLHDNEIDQDLARLRAILWTDYLGFLTEQRDPLAIATCEIALEAAHDYRKFDTLHARLVLLKCREVAADIKIRANEPEAIHELGEIHEEIHGLGNIAPNDAQIERQHMRLALRLAQHHELAKENARSLSFVDELNSLTKRATDRDPMDSVAWRIAADSDSVRYRLSSANPELLVHCGRSMAGAIEGRAPTLDDVDDLQAAAKLWADSNTNRSPRSFLERIDRDHDRTESRQIRLLVDSAVIAGVLIAGVGQRPDVEEELRATSTQWLDLLSQDGTNLNLWIALYGLRILDLTWSTAGQASKSFSQHVRNRLDPAWAALISRAKEKAPTIVSVEVFDLLAKIEERAGDLDSSLELRLLSSRGSSELARLRPDRWEFLRDQLVNVYFTAGLFRKLGDEKNAQASKLSAKRVLILFDQKFPGQPSEDIDAVRAWAEGEG